METLTVTRARALNAFKKADKSVKAVLAELFEEGTFARTPIERIKSYEDACEDQEIQPIKLSAFDFLPEEDRIHAFADHMATIIVRALNADWKADYGDANQAKYYVWYKWVGSGVGFSFNGCGCDCSSSFVGSRHTFRDRASAEYFAKQFNGIMNDYLI